MPGFPVAATELPENSASINVVDVAGDDSDIQISGFDSSVTQAQIDTWTDTVTNITNAGMRSRNTKRGERIADTQVVAFDEALSTVTNGATFVFENASLVQKSFTIPAADFSIFESDGETVIRPGGASAIVTALVTATLAILNAGTPAGTFAFARGYRSDNTRKRRRGKTRPTIQEPAIGDLPGPGPGL